ncbi:hypothetical protein C10C_0022 [Chlamydia serpentis]|uniref:Macro domain-containing protein n=1 Tax=Chlamydia serpentis TaxID=1967782 RepID=A0A2R8F9W8_9CHLA|nr:hypothetical protein [Chlamydia serpentis]SPN73213.1 hypothetical protein C10C_0022 [Chlamydia serpentis]
MNRTSTPTSVPPSLSHASSPISFHNPCSEPSPPSPLEAIPSQPQNEKADAKSSIIKAVSCFILGLALLLSGILSVCLSASLSVSIPIFILTAIFIGLALLYFIKHLKERPTLTEEHLETPAKISPEPAPKALPIPEEKILIPPTPKAIPKTKLSSDPEIRYPLKWDYSILHAWLKSLFDLDPDTDPTDRLKSSNLTSVTMRSKTKPCFRLHCFQGMFSTDKLLNKQSGAIVVTTNSSMDFSMTVGRTSAVTARLSKRCWETIKDTIPSQEKKLPIGACISGPWTLEEGDTLYASHLIAINPPTLETLIPPKLRRAITFQDFNIKTAYANLVKAYLQCFDICIQSNVSSIQVEILGLKDLSKNQEEFTTWHYCCQLALVEALRILLESEGTHVLSSVSVNSINELPLKVACQALFWVKKS